MGITLNSNRVMREKSNDDFSPSIEEIEDILGIKIDSSLGEYIDSISGKEAYDLLCELLDSSR